MQNRFQRFLYLYTDINTTTEGLENIKECQLPMRFISQWHRKRPEAGAWIAATQRVCNFLCIWKFAILRECV